MHSVCILSQLLVSVLFIAIPNTVRNFKLVRDFKLFKVTYCSTENSKFFPTLYNSLKSKLFIVNSNYPINRIFVFILPCSV